ncbi:MAG: glycosyltransferase family 4 protein [Pseudomonadota bacterium]
MELVELPDLSGRVVLQVIPDLAAGGAERTTIEVADAVTRAGGRALVVSRGGRMERDLTAVGGQLVQMNVAAKNPLTVALNARKLASLIEDQKVDLVHARSRACAWSAFWAARQTETPFVTTYHGAYSGSSGVKKTYNSIMARGDRVIANSNWTAERIRDAFDVEPDRLVTIPRGVDPAAFRPKSVTEIRIAEARAAWGLNAAENRLVLLLPGRMTPWKGQMVAIDALASMSEAEREGLLLVLMGDHQGRVSYFDALKDRIDEAGLQHMVRIAPHTTDMPAALAAADIVLAPSTRPEAFGRVAAEAGAMERPVIVADHGGAREIIIEGETGVGVAPGDPAALAGAVRLLVSIGPAARAGMGEAGARRVAERFSSTGLQAATLAVYTDLLKPGGRSA